MQIITNFSMDTNVYFCLSPPQDPKLPRGLWKFHMIIYNVMHDPP